MAAKLTRTRLRRSDLTKRQRVRQAWWPLALKLLPRRGQQREALGVQVAQEAQEALQVRQEQQLA